VQFVPFGRPDIPLPHTWVDVDGGAGTAAAVRHLARLGHRRIAFIGWPEGSATGDRRAEGFGRALAELGLPYDAQLDVRIEDGAERGANAFGRLLDLDEAPTAVICVSDTIAVGALSALSARGLVAGRDIAVTGFDDTPIAPLLTPPLTSVRQPLEAVARRIVSDLTSVLAGADGNPAGELLAPELIVRASTQPD
jgi:DNA-binding LacI/PurR family transcriptional regulator